MKCWRIPCDTPATWSVRVESRIVGGTARLEPGVHLGPGKVIEVCDQHKAWFLETSGWLIRAVEKALQYKGIIIDVQRTWVVFVPIAAAAHAVPPGDDIERVGRFFGVSESTGLPLGALYDVVRVGPPLIVLKLFGCLPRDLAREIARELEAFGGGEIAVACACDSPTCYRASLSPDFMRHCLEIIERLTIRPRVQREEVTAKAVRRIAPIPLAKVRR